MKFKDAGRSKHRGFYHRRRFEFKLGDSDTEPPGGAVEVLTVFTELESPLTSVGETPPHRTPGWMFIIPFAIGGAIKPPGGQTAMLLDVVGQGAIPWLATGGLWKVGMAVGGYGGVVYGEPPTGCVANMEMIWALESFGWGIS